MDDVIVIDGAGDTAMPPFVAWDWPDAAAVPNGGE